ncbi:MAG: acyl--CoA ligase [Deltaproteobacteria bacterium]|nr:acyl--CoA ligase [Deltaproteobacteria bacterium]
MFISHVEMIEQYAAAYPEKVAIVFKDRRITYGAFNDRINRLANALMEMGIRKGDHVAILFSNCVEMIESFYAILKAGAVIVPLNPMVKGNSLGRVIDDSDSVALICGEQFTREIDSLKDFLPKIPANRYIRTGADAAGYAAYESLLRAGSPENPGTTVFPEDVFNIMYSSGTTGLPKGIVHTHDFRLIFTLFGGVMGFGITGQAIVCNSTALYHNGSLFFVMSALYSGGTVVLMDKFDPGDFLELVQAEKVTHAYLVPTQFIRILELPELKSFDTRSLAVVLSMAAPLTRKTKEEILANFDFKLFEAYGLTEGGAGTLLLPEDQLRKIGSVGKIALGDMRIVDEEMNDVKPGEVGEIIGRCALMMKEYYKQPEKTAETIVDGWVKTGDLGRFDDEGYLYLVGRMKDMIVSGGVNIYPEDIEEIIIRHPKVLDVAVFGVPHDKWGESPTAAAVLRNGETATETEIMEWTNGQVAGYQKISGVLFMDELPRNPSGKVLKRELRVPFWERTGRLI